jgi:hypothetical protein
MDDEVLYCARCSRSTHVIWCPVFDEYFCPQCLWVRTEKELNPAAIVVAAGVAVTAECL